MSFFFTAQPNRASSHSSPCTSRSYGYTCLFPGCVVRPFPHLAALDRHMQQHFGLPPIGQGLDAPYHGLHTSNLGSVYFMPDDGGQHSSAFTPPALAFDNAADVSTNASTAVASSATSFADQRHYCPHPGCGASVKHAADLGRHMKKHQDGPKEYDCPMRGCRRQGVDGFTRKDKLNDHLKAKHKMAPL